MLANGSGMAMTSSPFIQTILRRVEEFCRAKDCVMYVVGGVVRDWLLQRQRPVTNVDLAIASNALAVGRAVAHAVGGSFVCLSDTPQTARIVVSSDGEKLELDLSDFRGATIEEDLARRDFTINALAVPLADWCHGAGWTEQLIDPIGGRQDLAQRRLRVCFPRTFEDDPVRILRAWRFAAELDCAVDDATASLITEAAAQLDRVAGERIRDELIAILRTDRAGWAVTQLDRLGVLERLIPTLAHGRGIDQGGYHHLDVLHHQLDAVARADVMMAEFGEFSPDLQEPLRRYCAVELVEHRPRTALIKLGALLHDVGKPATKRINAEGDIWFLGHEQFGATLVEAVAERLCLSNRETDMVRKLVLYHLRPGYLSREPHLTRRAIFRFFRELGDDGPACLLLWWADRLATRGSASRLDQIPEQRQRLEELLRAYFFKPEEAVRPPKLLDGHELMATLKLSSGPQVGRLLQAIEEAQAEGRVHSKEEAILLARHVLAQTPRR